MVITMLFTVMANGFLSSLQIIIKKIILSLAIEMYLQVADAP